jgi:hypothetical protein
VDGNVRLSRAEEEHRATILPLVDDEIGGKVVPWTKRGENIVEKLAISTKITPEREPANNATHRLLQHLFVKKEKKESNKKKIFFLK